MIVQKQNFCHRFQNHAPFHSHRKRKIITRINPTLTQNENPPSPKGQGVQTSTLRVNVSNYSYIFCFRSKYILLCLLK